jgi:hypothetical protein
MSDVSDVIPAVALPRVPVAGGGSFPVHRIYCVGRNFADHAREMGAAVPAADDRGRPMFFSKPADAIVVGHDDAIPYRRRPPTCTTKWSWWWRSAAMRPPASWPWPTPTHWSTATPSAWT